jgi:hypothetical protein
MCAVKGCTLAGYLTAIVEVEGIGPIEFEACDKHFLIVNNARAKLEKKEDQVGKH